LGNGTHTFQLNAGEGIARSGEFRLEARKLPRLVDNHLVQFVVLFLEERDLRLKFFKAITHVD
jgi:hypothetical protein